MAHLHFDCFSGVSGDMILGALVDAGLPLKDLTRGLKSLLAGKYRLQAKPVMRGGLHATKVEVVIRSGFASPLPLVRIRRAITTSDLPARVKELSLEVFERLAGAEGVAHRVSPSLVQFHEIGVVDSIVDVVGGILGCHLIGADRITASPINVGAGMVAAAHGRLPVPGPAVAALTLLTRPPRAGQDRLLARLTHPPHAGRPALFPLDERLSRKTLPIYSAGPACELATPTGVALLTVLAEEFCPLPPIRSTAIGYGAGAADPEGWPNVLRLFLGDGLARGGAGGDTVVQIETNLDDLNPQAYETVMERLFAAGALDVTLTPVIMKRGRPGITLTALATRDAARAVAAVVLRETTTLGVRMLEVNRLVLDRRIQKVKTHGGMVRVKVARTEAGEKASPEYQDCRKIAERTGRPVREVLDEALRLFAGNGRSPRGPGKARGR